MENLDVDSGEDSDFEAELAAISAGETKVKRKPQKPKAIPQNDLDKMVAESLRDIGFRYILFYCSCFFHINTSFDLGSDEELSGDDDDPDLLSELSQITGNQNEENIDAQEEIPKPATPISDTVTSTSEQLIQPTTTMNTIELLKSRIEMYKLAEKIARESNDSTRARSRARGIKMLEYLLKQAIAGKTINPDEIPPVVSTKAPNTPQEIPFKPEIKPEIQPIIPTASEIADKPTITTTVDESKIKTLLERQREYKLAALTAKKSGDTATALQYVKIIKVFDTVLTSAQRGEAVDLSDMPPPPSEISSELLKSVGQSDPSPISKQEHTMQKTSEESSDVKEPANVTEKPQQKSIDLPPPEVPKTILEALTQRLQKYQGAETNAKAEGNDRRARQNGRIVKQYLDAIKAHKAGRSVAFDELPTPPGYPPIPVNEQNKSTPVQKPALPPISTQTGEQSSENTSPKKSPIKRQDSRISGNHSQTSLMNKTIEILLERQREFKEAALEAKKAGEIQEAKEFLKTFKGIESLLNVARGGLPVDLSTVSEITAFYVYNKIS